MKPKIITGHTLEEYNKKYGDNAKLIKVTSATAKNKPELLDNKKWWLINGTYYQVPKNTWMIPTFAILGVAALTPAVVFPIMCSRSVSYQTLIHKDFTEQVEILKKTTKENGDYDVTLKNKVSEDKDLIGIDNITIGDYTCKTEDYSFDKLSLTVTIFKATMKAHKGDIVITPKLQIIYSLTLDKDKLDLYFGDTYQLIATVKPKGSTVTWKSDKPEIASVDDNGLVTPHTQGIAVITASSNGLEAKCTVTTGYFLSIDPISMTLGYTASRKINAVVKPSTSTINWESKNTEIATVDNEGNVTAKNTTGNVEITATANGITKTCNVRVEPVISTKFLTLTVTEKTTLTWTKSTYKAPGETENKSWLKYSFTGYDHDWQDATSGTAITFGDDTTRMSLYLKGSLKNSRDASASSGFNTLNIKKTTNATATLKGCMLDLLLDEEGIIPPNAFHTLFSNSDALVAVEHGKDDKFLPSLTLSENCYYELFSNCSSLVSVPEDLLPATTLAKKCYYRFFYNCSSISKAPSLPALEMAESCYGNMFTNCKSLLDAPNLPATKLATSCYNSMFFMTSSVTNPKLNKINKLPANELAPYCYANMYRGCSDIKELPSDLLPATKLAENCYQYMFGGCAGLTTLPEDLLPASELSSHCYENMFNGCTGFVSLPTKLLQSTKLAAGCYWSMFQGCTSLKSVPELPATDLLDVCYYNIFSMNKLTSVLKISEGEPTSCTSKGKIFTCPSYTQTSETTPVKGMFTDTVGTFNKDPTIGNTYYWYIEE